MLLENISKNLTWQGCFDKVRAFFWLVGLFVGGENKYFSIKYFCLSLPDVRASGHEEGEAGLQLAVGSHGTLVMCLASFGPSEDNLSQYSLGFGRQFYRGTNHGF